MARSHPPPGRPHDPRRRLGEIGETLVAQRLERAGYRILDRNVRCGGVELDLVVARGRLVAFVEVKTRRSRGQGPPEQAVDARKRARLVRGAAAWLREHPGRAGQVRFDVAAVAPGAGGRLEMRLLEGAFDAGDL